MQTTVQSASHVSEGQDQIILHTFNMDHSQDDIDLKDNDEGDHIGTVPTSSSADAAFSDEVVLTNEDETAAQSAPEKSPTANELRKISEELFVEAYRQRKMDNLKVLKQYEDFRSRYSFLYIELLKQIENTLYQKTNQTRLFATELINFFTEIVATYRQHAKDCAKSHSLSNMKNPMKTKKGVWLGAVEAELWHFLDIRQDYIDNVKVFYRWVEKSLLNRLTTYLKQYNNAIVRKLKDLERLEDKINERTRPYNSKLNKILTSLGPTQESEPSDLLCQEFELFNLNSIIRQKMLDMGKFMSNYWQTVQTNQQNIYSKLRELVKQYLIEYGKITNQSEKSKQTIAICEHIQANNQYLFSYVWESTNLLQRQELSELLNIKFTQKKELLSFMNMESVTATIPEYLLRTLITKRFKANLSSPVQIFCTIDGFLVFYTEGEAQLKKRMAISKLTNTLEPDNTVIVKQKQKGLFKDTYHKETLKFERQSDAEQFMFYAEGDDLKKESYFSAEN